MLEGLSAELREFVEARLARLDAACADAGVEAPRGAWRERIGRVLLVSDFADDWLRREPALLAALAAAAADARSPSSRPVFGEPPFDDQQAQRALRRWRQLESVRLIARDVGGVDTVEDTLRAASAAAETCIEAALDWLEPALEARFGVPQRADGRRQRLVVLALGKLGGHELNFSSDIDLVFAFAEAGHCRGGRALDHEDFYARLGQRLIQLLAEPTIDGFAYRVDMRLRPFGSAGRLAISFAALEQYYQREGRDWERYAWVKARAVAGDVAGGARLIETLKPFVYRRYLDYGAIDGLRAMKALIDAEVTRRELADDLKLGPGGIREIEFMVQLVQLVRGGREASLRTPTLLAALAAAERLRQFDPAAAQALREAYGFLRRVENRLQMAGDQQTQALPADARSRARLAAGLGFGDVDAFLDALDRHRRYVARAFAEVLASAPARASAGAAADAAGRWWQVVTEGAAAPADGAFSAAAIDALRSYARLALARAPEPRVRQRLDRVIPGVLADAARSAHPDAALTRTLTLLQAIAGRPSYLALLDERPAARTRVVDAFARSAFLAERVSAHPLALDELLDPRLEQQLPDATSIRAELAARLASGADAEDALHAWHEVRHGVLFRLGLAWLDRRIGADLLAQRLASLADALLETVLARAATEVRQQHGAPPGLAAGAPGLLVIGYGSLGGAELGFGSDLDLVFVYDGALAAAPSDGARPLEGQRWFARVAQRVVHWLTTPMRSGRLYDVDTRLRPDGAKGLLVLSLNAFADYQRERAWTWEHQALVRARAIAGDAALAQRWRAVRGEVLARARGAEALRAEVRAMRERWRSELDRSSGAGEHARFDLKQGRGGLVDLEFLLQALVLERAAACPALLETTRTRELIGALGRAAALGADEAPALTAAHETLLSRALDCSFDLAPRVVALDPRLAAQRDVVLASAGRHGLADA
jgi:glutamate-ammonia-ligase adenylyltransferase